MKKRHITLSILAILIPWLVLLIKDEPLMAIIALILQASIIGWIPAAIWAWRSIHGQKIIQPTPTASTNTNMAK
jgi:uncharacterized membrane protein YqaE (UPF0057 family)